MPTAAPIGGTAPGAGTASGRGRGLHVGVVTTYLPSDRLGGAQLQATWMARELAAQRLRVTLFARGVPGRAYDGHDLPGVELVVRRPRLPGALRLAHDVALALPQIRRHRPDVLVCHQVLAAGLIGSAARRLLGVPALVWVHGRHEYRFDHASRFRLLTPWVLRHADRVLVSAATIRREVLEAFERRGPRALVERLQANVRVLSTGVHLQQPREGSGEHVVFCGRLIRAKGVHELVEAMRHVPNERLVMTGDGPERAALEGAARGLPVTLTGHIPYSQVLEHMRRAKCLVLPSHTEAFPNVVLEAMTLGVPVVATRVGGTQDLVADGVTGFLVPPQDPPALAAAIRKLTSDEPLRLAMGRNAHAAARHYDWPNASARLLALIDEVLTQSLPQHDPSHADACR